MCVDRFGSYSNRLMVPITPVRSLLKSIIRYRRLCPPPLCHTVTLPALFRPPVFFNPTVSALSGLPGHNIFLDVVIRPR